MTTSHDSEQRSLEVRLRSYFDAVDPVSADEGVVNALGDHRVRVRQLVPDRRSRSRLVAAAAAAAVLVAAALLAMSLLERDPRAVVQVAPQGGDAPTTSSPVTDLPDRAGEAPLPQTPDPIKGSLSAEPDLQFDFGRIHSISVDGKILFFYRSELPVDAKGAAARCATPSDCAEKAVRVGPEIGELPLLYGNAVPPTPLPPEVLSYVLSPDVRIRILDPAFRSCEYASRQPSPVLNSVDLAELAAYLDSSSAAGRVPQNGVDNPSGQDALAFNADGRVVEIRVAFGCV